MLGISVLLPFLFYSAYLNQENFSLLISAFMVLLITGIIDDFNPIPVAYKFLGQFIPAIVIVTSMDSQDLVIPFIGEFIRFPFFFNYLFWILFVVMAINAFNLIDGIDGLAIGLGIICGLFYFKGFYEIQETNLQVFTIALCAGLLGLLIYNMSDRFKIFLGDTGSLLIGGLLVYFALNYISSSIDRTPESSFFMVIATILIPLFDMFRLTIIRIRHSKSPFLADKEHIHHVLLDLFGGSHLITTSMLLIGQLLVIYFFSFLKEMNNGFLIMILLLSFTIYFGILEYLRQRRNSTIN